eukprot:TRINITY_DN351_c0_g2_i2.p1 TRINITY_DN351_c0_g2~~TRINITY_DN351_c0_g2_i2.p1  ORF type:complete len:261 (+),score=28.93 TRINITY_DN351_c0_g2_i2:2-784(+)
MPQPNGTMPQPNGTMPQPNGTTPAPATVPVAPTDLCFNRTTLQCPAGDAACNVADQHKASLAAALLQDIGHGVALGDTCISKAACGEGGCALGLTVNDTVGTDQVAKLAQCSQAAGQCQGLQGLGLRAAAGAPVGSDDTFPVWAVLLPIAIVCVLCICAAGVAIMMQRQRKTTSFASEVVRAALPDMPPPEPLLQTPQPQPTQPHQSLLAPSRHGSGVQPQPTQSHQSLLAPSRHGSGVQPLALAKAAGGDSGASTQFIL